MSPIKAAARMTAIYLIVGFIWILFSDRALDMMVQDQAAHLHIQTYKGWAYVVVTGILFGALAWGWLRRQQQLHERDVLTGLLNWCMFREVLNDHLESARSTHKPLAMVVLNIDGFRQLNSQLGQRQGDLLLQSIAEKLRTHFPLHASISRVSADEFCVAVRDVCSSPEWLSELAQLQVAISDTASRLIPSARPTDLVSCSMGVAYFPQDANQSKALITAANLALAEAKEQGRGLLREYSQAYGDTLQQRTQLIADLRQAIEEKTLSMAYQPQFEGKTNKLISVEALVRWSHPLHGPVAPDVFVHLAEQHGFVGQLTDFVCERVIQDLSAANMFAVIDHVSINVSAHDINAASAFENFVNRFQQHPQGLALVEQGKVQLEITETAVMQHIDRTLYLLKRLKQKGFGIAVDDFGTGYSSLGVLSRLPVDELKIDRLFVHDIAEKESDLLIVRTIIAMAHALNLRVVAEGIENQQQIDLLNGLNCDRLQGYYLGRPIPPTQLKALHDTGHPGS